MNYILSQISSLIGLLIAIYIPHIRRRQYVIIWQIIGNVTGQISFFLLGQFATSTNSFIGTLQLIALYIADKKNASNKVNIIITSVASALVVGNTILTHQSWLDLLPCLGVLAYAVGISLSKLSQFRWCMLCSAVLWFVYDAAIANFAMMLTHGSVMISTITAKWHLDWHKKGGADKE